MQPGHSASRRSESGITLVEMIVAVGLLVLIVTALLGAFNQTTRAFKTGFNQTDVQESGRAAIEMVTRVLTDLSPSGRGNINPDAFSLLTPLQSASGGVTLPLNVASPRQQLFMQKLLVLHRSQDEWIRTAFLVAHLDSNAYPWGSPQDVVIGSLYRYQSSPPVLTSMTNRLFLDDSSATRLLEPRDTKISNIDPTRYSRVVDGIVHFSIRTSNVGAEWVDSGRVTNLVSELGIYRRLPGFETLGVWSRFPDGVSEIYTGDMLPSYVEVEIGLLEHEALTQVRALLADKVATSDFLKRNAHRVHFFRQRVPIRLGVSL